MADPILRILVILFSLSAIACGADWPQWRGLHRDGTWTETGVIESFAEPRLPQKWSAEIGPGYSGPTVAKGLVYITDRLVEPGQVERVHCFDADTGARVWSHSYDCPYIGVGYDAGPRAAVTVVDDRAVALGSMGDLIVFSAATGEVLWHRRLAEEYQIEMPIWGIAASPLVFGDLVIVQIGGKEGACVVALNISTGEEVWRALDDRASYSSPVITQQAGQDVLVVWTGDNVAGLNPQTGDVHWKSPMEPVQMVIGIATPVIDHGQLFVTSFYDGSKMMRLAPDALTATETWRFRGPSEKETEALHSIIATPILRDGYLYGVDSYGELRCLEAATGKRIWEDRTATPPNRWSNIHMVQNGERTWMFNEIGELIIAKLSPSGFEEISRAQLIEPTTQQLNRRGRGVCWAHPAFADRHVFARNDHQLISVSLAGEDPADD